MQEAVYTYINKVVGQWFPTMVFGSLNVLEVSLYRTPDSTNQQVSVLIGGGLISTLTNTHLSGSDE